VPTGRRQYPTDPTPQNLRLIWDRIFAIEGLLTTAQATITQQATTITTLQADLAKSGRTASQALITAGQAIDAATGTPSDGGDEGPSGDDHPNHFAEVTQAKADVVAAGESIAGVCGAFKIVKTTAWRLRFSDPTIGLLSKPSGTNCGGYSGDIICYTDGIIFDILQDAGGANTPQWNFAGQVDPDRYRVPIVPEVP